jgi:O-antigen/teichoic acid export membrane protein
VIAVLLGPEGVGVVGVVDQVVLVVMQLSALSLPQSGLTFLSRSYGRDAGAFEQTYLSFFAVVSTLTVVGTTCAVAMVVARSSLLGENLLRYQPLLILGLLSVPTLAISALGANVLAAAQRARQSALVVATSAMMLFLAAAVGIALGGLAGLYWASLVAGVVVAGAIMGHLHRRLSLPLFEWRVRIADEIRRHPDLVFFCVSYSLVAAAYPLAWLIARHTVLDQFGEAEAGRLQAVVALMVGFGTALRSVNSQLLLPIVSAHGDIERKFRDTIEVQRRLTVTLALMAIPLILFPQWFLAILYSNAFTAASPYVHLFILAELILILSGTYLVLILGLGDMRAWAVVYLIGYACLGVMSWGLGVRHGILGVAVAAIVASLVMFGLALWRLRSRHGFRLPRGLLGLMILVITTVLGAGMACARYNGDGAGLLVKAAALLLAVPALIRCLDKEDRAWVRGFLVRRRPRST